VGKEIKMEKKKKKLLFAAVVFSFFMSSLALAINDPIAHWKLDETSGLIAEDSAGDNDGTLVNGPIWTTGIIDGALHFNRVDEYVEVADNIALEPQQLTVAAWVYRESTSTRDVVLKKGSTHSGDNRNGYLFRILESTSIYPQKARLYIVAGSNTNVMSPVSETEIEAGIWYHLAATYDGSYIRIYVNGQEEGTPTLETRAIDYSGGYQDFKIGVQEEGHGSLCYHFDGKIDDVRIYGRALSAQEIEELFLGEEPELVGLEITGPDEAAEDSQTQYSAIALYDNNSTADVTDNALWSVEPNVIADIEAGLLTTEKIFQPEELEIYAQYSEDGNTFDANKPVSVFAICPSGSALQFDGVNDYVNLGLDPDLQPALPVTISTWIKLENLGQNQYILDLDKELGWHSGIWFFVRDENSLTIGYGDGGSSGPWSRRSKVGTSTLDAGIWYHVAAVLVAPTDLTIYINGEDDGGVYGGTGGDLAYRNKESFIGTLSTDRHFFNGIIDEMVIYDRALSAQEIQISMHVPLEGNEPNLIAYWNFDEGAGQVAHDTSGNANDGQLGSSPDIDDSDPNWVDSDAPVGICTLEELVERNVNNALEIKLSILEQIEEALLMEDASVNILDGLFGQLDYGYLDKRDIRRVRQEIHSAIQSEEQAIHSVEKSVDDLEDSLEILGSEDEPPDSNSPNDSRLMNRLLIPLKK
jgi:hypothetical protein